MDNGLGRRPLLALEPPHRILANVPQTGSISREHWDLPDQALKLVQISSSSGQVDQRPKKTGSTAHWPENPIEGIIFSHPLSPVVLRPSRLVFVRQLRQIFCVLIKHGLRPTVPLCRSSSRPRSGRVWTCICIQRTGFAAITLLLPKDLPVGVARCPSPNTSTEHATHRARHNINVFTLRSIFPPWKWYANIDRHHFSISEREICQSAVQSKAKEEWKEWRNRPQGQL